MRMIHLVLLTFAGLGSLLGQDAAAELQVATPSPLWQQASVGRPWMLRLEAKGGVAPYQWEVTEGALPPGMHMVELSAVVLGADPGPGFYGAPSDAGSWTATVRVTDANGAQAQKQLQLDVSTLYLQQAGMTVTASQVCSWQLEAKAGTGPYSFRLGDAGFPPLGCELGTDGAFSGQSVLAGEYAIPVEVRDAGGLTLRTTVNLSVYGAETSVPPLPLRLTRDGLTAKVEVPALAEGVSVAINWGDGASTVLSETSAVHAYAEPGEATVQAMVANQTSGEQATAEYRFTLVPPAPSIEAQSRSLASRKFASPSTLSLGSALGLW